MDFVTLKKRIESMLVLTRKIGEELVIDGHIRVVINSIKGNRVSIGIKAPPNVYIVRSELLEEEDKKLKKAG